MLGNFSTGNPQSCNMPRSCIILGSTPLFNKYVLINYSGIFPRVTPYKDSAIVSVLLNFLSFSYGVGRKDQLLVKLLKMLIGDGAAVANINTVGFKNHNPWYPATVVSSAVFSCCRSHQELCSHHKLPCRGVLVRLFFAIGHHTQKRQALSWHISGCQRQRREICKVAFVGIVGYGCGFFFLCIQIMWFVAFFFRIENIITTNRIESIMTTNSVGVDEI